MFVLQYGIFITIMSIVVTGFRTALPRLFPRKVYGQINKDINIDSGVTMSSYMSKALQAYVKIIGRESIPSNFIVPHDNMWPPFLHGYRLGDQLRKLVSRNDFVSSFPVIADELQKLGFSMHPIVSGWDVFYDALVKFKRLYGHVNVPYNFIVPRTSPWSKLEWDLKLGIKLLTLRSVGQHVCLHDDKIKELIALGFEWNPQDVVPRDEMWSDDGFCRFVTGLLIFHDNFPEQDIPTNFSIPNSELWPIELHDMKLGSMIHSIRGSFEALNSSNRIIPENVDFDCVLKAVQIFKHVYNHVNVVEDFVIPEDQTWPIDLWGLELGRIVRNMLENNSASEPQRQLVELLKSVEPSQPDDLEVFEGDSMVHEDTAQETQRQQESKAKLLSLLLNSRLSSRDGRIRKVATYEGGLSAKDFSNFIFRVGSNEKYIQTVTAKRYRRIEFGRFSWSDALQCFNTFKNLHGHIDIPDEFSIDEEAIRQGFSKSHFGFDIGDASTSLRLGDVDGFDDLERKLQLDKLQFNWGDTSKRLHFRFVPTWLGLKHFLYIFGHSVVSWNFVVPYSEEWPLWMMGMPLGNWIRIAKAQHSLLAESYPRRKELLDALSIDWTIPIEEKLFLDQTLFSNINLN